MSDLRVMRERQIATAAALDRPAGGGRDGSQALCVVTTLVATYPTTAAVFYACNPVIVTGSEAEGATPSFSADSTVIYALNLGTMIPPLGTYLVAHEAGGRWTFRYDG
jgi:hypothetical protein